MIDLNWLKATFPGLSDVERLGRGGQKEVFTATHSAHGPVVLKVFHTGADRERALREVRSSLELAGARIPKTLELGTMASPMGAVLWLLEQHIPGENLRQVLGKRTLTAAETYQLAHDALHILAAAEKADIVHRDVKPDNIIMDTDGQFWLIDFGLARHLNLTSLTLTAAPFGVGTPGYAPPEQFRNRKDKIDGRADLFGLGITLYEIWEGNNPLRDGTRDFREALVRTETQSVPRITSIAEYPGLDDLIFSMTRSRRTHRPETVSYALEWFLEVPGVS